MGSDLKLTVLRPLNRVLRILHLMLKSDVIATLKQDIITSIISYFWYFNITVSKLRSFNP